MPSTHKAQLSSGILVGVPHTQVEDSIVQGPSDEPFDGEVVDSLGCFGSVVPR